MLNILDGYNLRPLGDRTAPEMHLVIEAFRRAYMDRNNYLGDPDYVKIPIDQLISKNYGAAWRASIDADHVSPPPRSSVPRIPSRRAHNGRRRQEAADTTHYSVVDAQGDAVPVTTTLNGGYGSGVTVPGLGFLLNNEMDDFASKQGVPNMPASFRGRSTPSQPASVRPRA